MGNGIHGLQIQIAMRGTFIDEDYFNDLIALLFIRILVENFLLRTHMAVLKTQSFRFCLKNQ